MKKSKKKDFKKAVLLSLFPKDIIQKLNTLIEWQSGGFVEIQRREKRKTFSGDVFYEKRKPNGWWFTKKGEDDGFFFYEEINRDILQTPFSYIEGGCLLFPLTNGLYFKVLYTC
jgi:hypothetical protein